jgi:HPt (histidine-containing phosphotransfer) domain-containing protein
MSEVQNTLDLEALSGLRASVSGDSEFLAELIDEFLDDAPSQLEALRAAAASGDSETARRAAHTLRGNSRTFGASGLASLCQQAEAAAEGGDLKLVGGRIEEIGEEWERVRSQLVDFRDGST